MNFTAKSLAAACGALIVAVGGSLLPVESAHAVAVYTGTFDPEDDFYQWNGTHSFSVSESCLSANGWRAANTGYGGYAFDIDGYAISGTFNSTPCAASLIGGSLNLRKKTGPDNAFKSLNFDQGGLLPNSGVWGVNVKNGQLAGVDSFLIGAFRFLLADEDVLFGPGYVFGVGGGGVYLRWESGFAPLDLVPIGLFPSPWAGGSNQTYVQNFADPVYLYANRCGVGECTTTEVTPGRAATPTFNRVPEPGSLALAGIAGLALAALSRRRRNG